MKIFRILLLFIALNSFNANSQVYCSVIPNLTDTTICPGDSVFISVIANLISGNQAFNFNNGTPPAGWNTVGGNQYSQPCGNGIDNTPYYWASTVSAGVEPGISTAAFDVSCGGYLIFDMVFAVQSGGAPCEGPDLIGEGVELQYSIDGGITWIPIIYYNPNGTIQGSQSQATGPSVGVGQQTPFTTWNTYTVPIPPGAMTVNTMFQWTQYTNSGTCCDNWGLDNIIINASGPPCGSSAVVNWNNGLTDTTSFWAVPTGDTAFVAWVYDTLGNYWCESDSIFVWLSDGNFTYNLQDFVTVYCPDDSAQASVTNVSNAVTPMSYLWSNGDTLNSSYLNAMGVTPDSITYFVEISDACGNTDLDSVILVVNQTLDVVSFTTLPQINCTPSGGATATVTGNQGPMTYSWTGPGSSGTYTSNQLSINGVTTGWYHFTVTDNVCSTSDSVFIDSLFVDNVVYTLPDTLMVYCPDDSIMVDIVVNGAAQPITYNWSNGATTANTYLNGSSLEHDTLIYTIDFSDACGIVRSDSVVLITNKTLNIDSLIMDPTTTCQPDGMVQAFVSGQTPPTQYLWENQQNWEQPGNGDSVTVLTWNNIGSNWYYFTVTDSECQDIDSIMVTMLDPPMAVIEATPDYGCSPLTVYIENNSFNTGYYVWDFGNGNTFTTTNTQTQVQIYSTSAVVTLNAYLDASQNCGDQASITITIPECGCTDPIADNYNPIAVIDDGSCTYPIPVVNPPNIFTPNGDGKNDFLYFESINAIEVEILITNRWGNVMYQVKYDPTNVGTVMTTGAGYSWDGRTPSGSEAEEGTYFYTYSAIGVNGDTTSGHGFIQLSRD